MDIRTSYIVFIRTFVLQRCVLRVLMPLVESRPSCPIQTSAKQSYVVMPPGTDHDLGTFANEMLQSNEHAQKTFP
jgi:hypothetical protein